MANTLEVVKASSEQDAIHKACMNPGQYFRVSQSEANYTGNENYVVRAGIKPIILKWQWGVPESLGIVAHGGNNPAMPDWGYKTATFVPPEEPIAPCWFCYLMPEIPNIFIESEEINRALQQATNRGTTNG